MKLAHDIERVREYYKSLPRGAMVGVEASARAEWFEKIVEEAGHKLVVGNPVLIRKSAPSRHKNDRRDAEHILDLLLTGRFPAIWRRPRESSETLEILRLRSSLVRQRTQIYNRLQALAHNVGMPKATMTNAGVRQMLKSVEMDESGNLCRGQLFFHANQNQEMPPAAPSRGAVGDDFKNMKNRSFVAESAFFLTALIAAGDSSALTSVPSSEMS